MNVKTLNTTHADYDADCLRRWVALYEGGATWRALIDTWIEKHPQELPDSHAARRNRARYVNHAGPLVDLLAGLTFEDPPVLADEPKGWTDNVDGRSTAFADWVRERLLGAAMVGRRAYAWVNLPAGDGSASTVAEQEERGLLTPYLVDLTAEEVINWKDDERGHLAALMFRRSGMEQPDLLAPPERVWRWTYIDGTQIRRWKWVATKERTVPLDTDDATEEPAIAHGFGRIPVARLVLPPGLHAMGKLEDPARALCDTENDLGWALYRGAHPLLGVFTDSMTEAPTLGAGRMAVFPEKSTAQYLEPGGACYSALETRIEKRREDVYRVVQQMAQSATADASKARASAASKAMDWAAADVMADAYSARLRSALSDLVAILAGKLPAWKSATVTGLSGWGEEGLSEKLAALQLAMPLVKSETFRREVAKRTAHALLDDAGDEVLSAVDREIDAADYDDEPVYAPGGAKGGGGEGEDDVDTEDEAAAK